MSHNRTEIFMDMNEQTDMATEARSKVIKFSPK
jgi:hypothetical protein